MRALGVRETVGAQLRAVRGLPTLTLAIRGRSLGAVEIQSLYS